jgi:hypothetical protein
MIDTKVKVERCHKCLTKITEYNCCTVNQWGKPECDDCVRCVHNIALSHPCGACEKEFVSV